MRLRLDILVNLSEALRAYPPLQAIATTHYTGLQRSFTGRFADGKEGSR